MTVQEILALSAAERLALNKHAVIGWTADQVQALTAHPAEYAQCGRGLKKSLTSVLKRAGLVQPKTKVAKRHIPGAVAPREVAQKYVDGLDSADLTSWLASLADETIDSIRQALGQVQAARAARAAKQAEVAALQAKLAALHRELNAL